MYVIVSFFKLYIFIKLSIFSFFVNIKIKLSTLASEKIFLSHSTILLILVLDNKNFLIFGTNKFPKKVFGMIYDDFEFFFKRINAFSTNNIYKSN